VAELAAHTEECDAVLFGRVTFEQMRGYWPEQENDETGITDDLNQIAKYVVSTTMDDPQWQNSVVLRDLDDVRALKEQPGKDIVSTGSIALVHDLIQAGLVDEYRLFVYPVVVGSGVDAQVRAWNSPRTAPPTTRNSPPNATSAPVSSAMWLTASRAVPQLSRRLFLRRKMPMLTSTSAGPVRFRQRSSVVRITRGSMPRRSATDFRLGKPVWQNEPSSFHGQVSARLRFRTARRSHTPSVKPGSQTVRVAELRRDQLVKEADQPWL
jgi:dihydrofolate reductase